MSNDEKKGMISNWDATGLVTVLRQYNPHLSEDEAYNIIAKAVAKMKKEKDQSVECVQLHKIVNCVKSSYRAAVRQ